jgi:hypothetical protein
MADKPLPKALPINDSGGETYDVAYETALDELDELMTQREALDEKRDAMDKRIIRLRKGLLGLGALCSLTSEQVREAHPELFPDSIDPDTGLSDAVREVLKTSDSFISPVFIRDFLRDNGYEISKYKNALASIHTVLKRLRSQGEVFDSNREGRTVYKWNPKQNPEPEFADDDIPF